MACPQSTRRKDFVGIAEQPRSIPGRDFAGRLCAQLTERACLARPTQAVHHPQSPTESSAERIQFDSTTVRMTPIRTRSDRRPYAHKSREKRCRENSIPGVKAKAEVNEMSAESSSSFTSAEHDLPTVTVAQPSVQRENAGKLSHVFNL